MSRGSGGGYDNQNTTFSPEARPSQAGMSLFFFFLLMIPSSSYFLSSFIQFYGYFEVLGQLILSCLAVEFFSLL